MAVFKKCNDKGNDKGRPANSSDKAEVLPLLEIF